MSHNYGNYSAFYMAEPFFANNLGIGTNATKEFAFYRLFNAWKDGDSTFPFDDSHAESYSVRDGSDWEKTLKPRIHDRLNNSKNIILFLSSVTKNSRALREEIKFGVIARGLPVIVIYPEYKEKYDIICSDSKTIKRQIKNLWGKLPSFRDAMERIPTVHIPNNKDLIRKTLSNPDFMINTKCAAGTYFYTD